VSPRRRVALLALAIAVALGGGATAQVFPNSQAALMPLVSVKSARPGARVLLALVVDIPAGLHLQGDQPRKPYIPTRLWIDPASGVEVREIVYPATKNLTLPFDAEPLVVFEGRTAIGIDVDLPASAQPGPLKIPARLRYQACNDSVCFQPVTFEVSWTIPIEANGGGKDPSQDATFASIRFGTGRKPDPKEPAPPLRSTSPRSPTSATSTATPTTGARLDDFTVLGTTGGYMGTGEFLRFIKDAETGVKQRGLFEGRGPFAILAIVFLGGLALNLTPCVLPMIPINLAIIGAGSQAKRRRQGLWLGAAYGAAMALVYGVLGLIVILTTGTFGTINASPWFNAGIALLFVVLALAMFDVIVVDFSRMSSRIRFNQSSRGSFLLAFMMGGVAALLAGACVAPVVIQVVLFASDLYVKGTGIALALPFVLGLGMALPWPIAGAGIATLPKPGAWMVRVKQVMGLFILGTAVYYGYVAYQLFDNRRVDPARVQARANEQLKSGWYASLEDGLTQAAAQKTPVLIDFWATWCKNCLVMDETTLADPGVKAALSNYTKVKFQAEDLDSEPAASLLKKFGAVGLPAYVILRPRQP
jgi:thioredoxin:protein disulfide reductase